MIHSVTRGIAARQPLERHWHVFQGWTMQEKRRYERVAFFCPIRLSVLPDGPDLPANSFDISIGGVGLVAPISLERGQEVEVHFSLKNPHGEPVEESMMGRVAYARADEDGNRIGVEFLRTLQLETHPLLARKLRLA
jgi:c-di-GMP-binding flagellar brake protein YcgR